MSKMENSITIQGHTFKYNEDNNCYECRGRVCYNDDNDEEPEASLWQAGEKLEARLTKEGHEVELGHSEKGWVEVHIQD